MIRGARGAAFAVALSLLPSLAFAQIATIDVLFDTDRDGATGCDVATVEGVASGVDLRLRTRVDLSTEVVSSIEHAPCVDPLLGVFGPDVPVSALPVPGWSVETGNGIEGSTLVESHVPLSVFGPARRARVYVALDSGGAADALLTNGGGGVLELGLVPLTVPGLGGVGLLALTAAAVFVVRSRVGRGVALVLVTSAGFLGASDIARALLGEGVHRAWSIEELVSSDPAADAPVGADLLGLSSAVDATSGELWLRVDVAFGPPVCLDWVLVDPGTGYSCFMWPPLDPSPFAGPVALTFDDGPDLVTTPQVLAILRANSIPATFFMVGDNLTTAAEQALALEIHQDPLFRVASHSVDHPDFTGLSAVDVEYQVDEGLARLRTAIGDPCWFPRYFRFPFGASDCTSMEIVRRRGQAVAGVNMDTVDWCYAANGGSCPPSVIPDIEPWVVNDLAAKALVEYQQHGGGIMLMHDIHPTTVAALPAVVSNLQGAGATFVHLTDLAVFPNLNAEVAAPEPPACCMTVGP